jgi:2-polyprenyl-6-methoxyphenol hydroxylase-like FAD-dependent oxidoreductase
MADCDVLIAGAGPTGLVLALWLKKLGVTVRVIDKAETSGTTSRALAVQVRTLELYEQLDLAREVKTRGLIVPAMNLWAGGKPVARVPLHDIGQAFSPEPGPIIFPQDEHEALLVERLETAGVPVERRTELVAFTQDGQGVTADIRGPGGEEIVRAAYIAGCDGARSIVRRTVEAGFPGGTYKQLFYVADIQGHGPPINGELNVDLDEADFLAIFPMKGEGRARLIGTVRGERAGQADTLKFEDVSAHAIENLGLKVDRVNWFSTYHVHHRVTDRFRTGRAFLLGDAAHIHNPAGGQGMNTGLGDAINLAWKLAAVLAGRADDRLLDSYEQERIGFARKLVATTDRAFTFATAEGSMADFLRLKVAPLFAKAVSHVEPALEFLFRTVGQISVHYPDSPLSAGRAGKVRGGDRLPWAGAAANNFGPLAAMGWQVHVYGAATEALQAWCASHKVPLHMFAWQEAHGNAGLLRDAVYLIRPDTYVALADSSGSPQVLERYFETRGIKP